MNQVEKIEQAKEQILDAMNNQIVCASAKDAAALDKTLNMLHQAYDVLSEVQYEMMSTVTPEDQIPAESIDDRINAWIERLNEIAPKHGDYSFELEIRPSAKYQRIVMHTDQQHGTSVHAFVDDSGNVYKSEGWKKPAKGVRYALEDDKSYAAILKDADWAGGYLYHNAQSYKVTV